MGMGPTKTLQYEGLTLELCKPEGHAEFYVWSIVVTGKQWLVEPGLRVGMNRNAVVKVLGPPDNASRDTATSRETLSYSYKSFDGYYGATLEKGRVVEISAGEDWS
jgi:hypothetical protein